MIGNVFPETAKSVGTTVGSVEAVENYAVSAKNVGASTNYLCSNVVFACYFRGHVLHSLTDHSSKRNAACQFEVGISAVGPEIQYGHTV
jgi:hypothetical protein